MRAWAMLAVAAIGACTLGMAAVWALGVTPSWVHVHAAAYARALLETCDESPSTSRPRKPRGQSTKTTAE